MSNANEVAIGYQEEATFGTEVSAELVDKTTVSAANADSSFNDSTEDLSVFTVGTFIKVSGFSEAANNDYFRVATSSANKITVTDIYGQPVSLADDPVGDTVTVETVLRTLRLTSEDLKLTKAKIESEELRADRQTIDMINSDQFVEGSLSYELSLNTYDDLMAAAIGAASWAAAVAVATADTDVAAVNATNKFTHAVAWDATPTAGQWIKVSGFATAGNNGTFKVVSADSTNIVVEGVTLTDEAATPAVTIVQGSYCENGVARRSFTVERAYTDLSNKYARFNGLRVATWEMEAAARGKVSGSFGFRGKSAVSPSPTATISKGTDIAANSNRIIDAIQRVTGILEDMTEISLSNISFSTDANLRDQAVIGNLGPTDIIPGSFRLTGSAQLYFSDNDLMDKFLADTRTRLAIKIEDAGGNQLVLDMPEVDLTDVRANPPGKDQDVMMDVEFSCLMDGTEGKTFRLVKF